MMIHFPFNNMPYYNAYSRYGYRYPYYSYNKYNSNNLHTNNKTNNVNNSKNSCKSNNIPNYNTNSKKQKNEHDNKNTSNTLAEDVPMFQLFGINLYFDDVLLIFLIWFLYDEGVKDDNLFLALIMLLLS